jgi:hypothetical protein
MGYMIINIYIIIDKFIVYINIDIYIDNFVSL